MTTYVRLADIQVGDKVRVSREAIVEEAGPTGIKLSTGDWYGSAFLDSRDYDVEVIERGPEPTVRDLILALPVGSVFSLAGERDTRVFVKHEDMAVREGNRSLSTFGLRSQGMFSSWTPAQFKVIYEAVTR